MMYATRLLAHLALSLKRTFSRDTNKPFIYKKNGDYILRDMTPEDCCLIEQDYIDMGYIFCPDDLRMTLSLYPSQYKKAIVGEIKGKPASAVFYFYVGNCIVFGGGMYVLPEFRGRGLSNDLMPPAPWIQSFLSDNVLVTDSVMDRKEFNEKRQGMKLLDQSINVKGIVGDKMFTVSENENCHYIEKVTSNSLAELIHYDNTCFVSRNFQPRMELLKKLTGIAGCITHIAKDSNGYMVGYGLRRPAIQQECHVIGPLYANDSAIAKKLIRSLCENIKGQTVSMDINMRSSNPSAAILAEVMGFQDNITTIRMHSGNLIHEPNYSEKIFAFTSYVCDI